MVKNFKNESTKKVLLVGGSSPVGRKIQAALGEARALSTYHSKPVQGAVHFDSLTMRVPDLGKSLSLDWKTFSHAIVLVGVSHPDLCARDRDASDRLNLWSVRRVLDDVLELGLKPVFISTEFVYNGRSHLSDESTPTDPILTYGAQKLEIEQYLSAHQVEHVCVRLAKTYGLERGDRTLLTIWAEALLNGRPIQCATDQIFSPVLFDDVGLAFRAIVDQNLSGTFCLGGPRGATRMEFLQELVKELRAHLKAEPQIEACKLSDFPLLEPRPTDVSMSSARLCEATGLRFTDLSESCKRIAKNVDLYR